MQSEVKSFRPWLYEVELAMILDGVKANMILKLLSLKVGNPFVPLDC